MTHKLFAVFLGFLVSALALGGEGSGASGGFCSYQRATCLDTTGKLVVCPGDETLYVGLDGNAHFYPVHFFPPEAGVVGGSWNFVGPRARLAIKVDTAPRPEGIYSVLSVEELGLQDVEVHCKMNPPRH